MIVAVLGAARGGDVHQAQPPEDFDLHPVAQVGGETLERRKPGWAVS